MPGDRHAILRQLTHASLRESPPLPSCMRRSLSAPPGCGMWTTRACLSLPGHILPRQEGGSRERRARPDSCCLTAQSWNPRAHECRSLSSAEGVNRAPHLPPPMQAEGTAWQRAVGLPRESHRPHPGLLLPHGSAALHRGCVHGSATAAHASRSSGFSALRGMACGRFAHLSPLSVSGGEGAASVVVWQ